MRSFVDEKKRKEIVMRSFVVEVHEFDTTYTSKVFAVEGNRMLVYRNSRDPERRGFRWVDFTERTGVPGRDYTLPAVELQSTMY